MSIDTPARIAILGAGPIGLEAALYARFLGYDVDIYEKGQIADHVRQWGHVTLFTPWKMNVTSLGVSAIQAQDPDWKPANSDAIPTGDEFRERYLLPLANTDLVADSLRLRTTVCAIGRENLLKGEMPGSDDRHEFPFRILLKMPDGGESIATADAVIDTTGTYANHNWLGSGGLPAIGERQIAGLIEYGVPHVLGPDRARYAGQHVLVIGSGYSAATSVVNLARLADEEPATRVTWLTRSTISPGSCGPMRTIENDRLPQRGALARAANDLVQSGRVEHIRGGSVHRISYDDKSSRWLVELIGDRPCQVVANRIVANVGYRPDRSIYEELQVHECYASEGPMKLAASMLAGTSSATLPADCLDTQITGRQLLLNPEPDFYILGSKSFGRGSTFLLRAGHDQIRLLFQIIGDREGLDLYGNLPKMP